MCIDAIAGIKGGVHADAADQNPAHDSHQHLCQHAGADGQGRVGQSGGCLIKGDLLQFERNLPRSDAIDANFDELRNQRLENSRNQQAGNAEDKCPEMLSNIRQQT